MAAIDTGTLLARARAVTPSDPGVRACWKFVVRGIEAGWLDDAQLRELVGALENGTDLGVQELAFEHLGDELRVSFLDDDARCAPAALRAELAGLLAEKPALTTKDLLARPIEWAQTGDGEFPYAVTADGHQLTVRINDFPAEPMYTIMIDGVEWTDLDDWPAAWKRPGAK